MFSLHMWHLDRILEFVKFLNLLGKYNLNTTSPAFTFKVVSFSSSLNQKKEKHIPVFKT